MVFFFFFGWCGGREKVRVFIGVYRVFEIVDENV